MKLQFDANQQFQQDAVRAVVDPFDGQPLQQQGVQVTIQTSSTDPLFSGTQQTELGPSPDSSWAANRCFSARRNPPFRT